MALVNVVCSYARCQDEIALFLSLVNIYAAALLPWNRRATSLSRFYNPSRAQTYDFVLDEDDADGKPQRAAMANPSSPARFCPAFAMRLISCLKFQDRGWARIYRREEAQSIQIADSGAKNGPETVILIFLTIRGS